MLSNVGMRSYPALSSAMCWCSYPLSNDSCSVPKMFARSFRPKYVRSNAALIKSESSPTAKLLILLVRRSTAIRIALMSYWDSIDIFCASAVDQIEWKYESMRDTASLNARESRVNRSSMAFVTSSKYF